MLKRTEVRVEYESPMIHQCSFSQHPNDQYTIYHHDVAIDSFN